jgi:hypothetical protein
MKRKTHQRALKGRGRGILIGVVTPRASAHNRGARERRSRHLSMIGWWSTSIFKPNRISDRVRPNRISERVRPNCS